MLIVMICLAIANLHLNCVAVAGFTLWINRAHGWQAIRGFGLSVLRWVATVTMLQELLLVLCEIFLSSEEYLKESVLWSLCLPSHINSLACWRVWTLLVFSEPSCPCSWMAVLWRKQCIADFPHKLTTPISPSSQVPKFLCHFHPCNSSCPWALSRPQLQQARTASGHCWFLAAWLFSPAAWLRG